jgi:acetyl esterase/lipase
VPAKAPPFHPDLRAARWIPNIGVTRRTLRLFRGAPRGIASTEHVEVTTVAVRTTAGDRPFRVFRPQKPAAARPALLWVHGGGLVIGTPQQDDAINLRIATELDIVVIAASYRLAPEHPAPAAVDDLDAGYRAILERADEFGIDPARVAIGGGSAGGGLAAALAQRLHDEGGPEPVFQLLVYPMLDDRTVLRTDIDTRHHRFWPASSNRFGWDSYLGVPAGSAEVPAYAVPARRDDLAGLPPAWIGVGTLDLFHDEDLVYAERLRAAGVPCEVVEVPGAFHGFDATFRKAGITDRFHTEAGEALRRGLGL